MVAEDGWVAKLTCFSLFYHSVHLIWDALHCFLCCSLWALSRQLKLSFALVPGDILDGRNVVKASAFLASAVSG